MQAFLLQTPLQYEIRKLSHKYIENIVVTRDRTKK